MFNLKPRKSNQQRDLGPSNAQDVPWYVQGKNNPMKHIEVLSIRWFDAIRLGAKALGLEVDQCECSMVRGVPITRDQRQQAVVEFVRETFGDAEEWSKDHASAMNTDERISRFVEEAIELAQSENMTIEQVKTIVDYVYSKPKGEPFQEVGGVGVTLLSYCGHRGISADFAEVTEFERVLKMNKTVLRSGSSTIPQRHRHQAKVAAGVATTPRSGWRTT